MIRARHQPEGRERLDQQFHGDVGRAAGEIDHAGERLGDVFTVVRLGPERGHGSARFDEMGARQVHRRIETTRDRRRHEAAAHPLRSLQLHQDRPEPLRERVVNIARHAVTLFEHRLPARFELALLREPAVVERQRRLAGGGIEQGKAPSALAI